MSLVEVVGSPAGMRLRPRNTAQNTVRPPDIFTPGVAVTGLNTFQTAHYSAYIAGDSWPRMILNHTGIYGGDGTFDPSSPALADRVSLIANTPPSGAVSGTTGWFAHKNVPLTSLGWRNVKRYGAKGDGSTLDHTAIQVAINAGNGVVYFPAGTYVLGSALSIPSNVKLQGAGKYRTLLTAAASMGGGTSMIVNTGISGSMATSVPITGVEICDLGLDGNKAARPASSGSAHGIWFRGANNAPCEFIAFKNLYIKNMPTMAMALQNVSRTLVQGCHIRDVDKDGVSFWGTATKNVVNTNILEGCGDDAIAFNCKGEDAGGFNISCVQADNTVVGNTIVGAGGTGGSGVALSGCKQTTVIGNTITSVVSAGIRVIQFVTTPATDCGDLVIVGNKIADVTATTGTGGQGIVVSSGSILGFPNGGGTFGNISRITIAENNIVNPDGHGIWVMSSSGGGSMDTINILGNTIKGVSGQDANSSGILVGGATGGNFNAPRSQHYVGAVTFMTDITVSDNTVENYPYYGIRMHGIPRATITDNRVQQNGLQTNAPGISAEGCTDLVIRGNRSRNLSGSGQTHGIQLISAAGVSAISDNMVSGNPTTIANTTPVGSFVYVWHNPGSGLTANPPPN